jgi:hypothetical protein
MKEYESVVMRQEWDVDDDYLTVEVQVMEPEFQQGDRVKVTVENLSRKENKQ